MLTSLMLLAPVSLLAGEGDVEQKEKEKPKEEQVQVVVTEIPEDEAKESKEQLKEETKEAYTEDLLIREAVHD